MTESDQITRWLCIYNRYDLAKAKPGFDKFKYIKQTHIKRSLQKKGKK